MDTADWITLAGTVVATGVGGVAFWQARVAKAAATSARRQADAAELQVSIMQQQLDAEEAARRDAAGPQFHVHQADSFLGGEAYAEVVLAMTAGPLLEWIKIRTRGSDVRGIVGYRDSFDVLPELETRHLSAGGMIALTVWLEYNASTPTNVTFDLDCCEIGLNGRRWQRSLTVSIADDADDKPRTMKDLFG